MYWLLLVLPLMVPFIAKYVFKRTYTYQEMGINCAVAITLTSVVYFAGVYKSMYDTEVLSGFVTEKTREWTSCEHSYKCRCRQVRSCSGSGKSKSCSYHEECDTCYEHSNDWDWDVKTTVGNHTINRVDRRGSIEPPRWTEVTVGEPAANAHMYTNYIKAVPDSLFAYNQNIMDKYKDQIPKYPEIYDYFKINRVMNFSGADTREWSDYLSNSLKSMGKEKQVNIIAILTDKPVDFADALFYSWAGGKKNDVVMVYGVKEGVVEWFQSTSVGNGMNNQELHITLRNESIGKAVDLELLKSQVGIINTKFNRLPMEQFEYLKDQVEPPIWVLIMALIVGLGSSLGVAYIFAKD